MANWAEWAVREGKPMPFELIGFYGTQEAGVVGEKRPTVEDTSRNFVFFVSSSSSDQAESRERMGYFSRSPRPVTG